MIEYQPNRNWLKDLLHLGTSWTLQRIVRIVLGIGAYASAVAVLILGFGIYRETLDMSVFSLLGVILSIILVFRTNTAYDRWWEGRKQWGALINQSRYLATQIDAIYPEEDQQSRQFYAQRISNFASALVDHLRDGTRVDSLTDPDDADLAAFERGENIPIYLVRRLLQRFQEARREELIEGFDLIALKSPVEEFLNIQGACERIKKTPIPFSYNVFIKLFISAYGLVLPFGLIPDYGIFGVVLRRCFYSSP